MSSPKRIRTEDLDLTECLVVTRLDWLIRHPDICETHRPGLAAYANALDTSGRLNVQYTRSGPGRLYPVNPKLRVATLQSRQVRATLFGHTHLDVDLVNCHPRLLHAIVRDCKAIDASMYRHLAEYVADREGVIERSGLAKTLAKKLLSTLIFGGTVERFRSETGHTLPLSD